MAARLPIDELKNIKPPTSLLVEAVLSQVQDVVRRKYAQSGRSWSDFRREHGDSIVTYQDNEQVEARILASGYRFDWSSGTSVRERPEIYKPTGEGGSMDEGFSHPDAPQGDYDDGGKRLAGVGDNVVRHERDITGTARFVRSNDRVLGYLTDGVPPGTIAVIDDSGGTLTAPIIEQFAGIICAGGTVRSHLGILAREYNIPCVMNAKVAGIAEGDTVTIEASAAAKTTEDYQAGIERVASVWRHRGEREVR